MNKSVPNVKVLFSESAQLQKDLKNFITTEKLSKEELELLEGKLNDLIDTLETLKLKHQPS